MPEAPVNISISNLSMLTLRRVHRRARRLALMTGLPLPVVITWWLEKLPESVSASDRVGMMAIEIELATLKRSREFEESLPDEYDKTLDAEPFDIDQWVEERTRQCFEALQLSPEQLDLAHQHAGVADTDEHADEQPV